MVFQPMRLAIDAVTGHRRGLLPRVFTLTDGGRTLHWRFLFCGARCHPDITQDAFPLGSMVALCCPDFPLGPFEAER